MPGRNENLRQSNTSSDLLNWCGNGPVIYGVEIRVPNRIIFHCLCFVLADVAAHPEVSDPIALKPSRTYSLKIIFRCLFLWQPTYYKPPCFQSPASRPIFQTNIASWCFVHLTANAKLLFLAEGEMRTVLPLDECDANLKILEVFAKLKFESQGSCAGAWIRTWVNLRRN